MYHNNILKFELEVSVELDRTLDSMATLCHSSKSDVLKKSIALMEIALQEKQQGNHLGVLSKDQKIIKEIIGL